MGSPSIYNREIQFSPLCSSDFIQKGLLNKERKFNHSQTERIRTDWLSIEMFRTRVSTSQLNAKMHLLLIQYIFKANTRRFLELFLII